MAIKQEAMDKFLKDHSMDTKQRVADKELDKQRISSERRRELIEKLLNEAWGRELWYTIIADADVLKLNSMTGNSHGFYIQGLQKIARTNMDWVKAFHFKEWLLMEQEAYNRRAKETEE